MSASVLDTLLNIIRDIKSDFTLPKGFKAAATDLIIKDAPSSSGEPIEIENGNIVIYTGSNEGSQLKQAIFDNADKIMDTGDRAVEADFARLIDDATPFSELEKKDNQLLEQLQGVVPGSDISIIRAALFIRRLYKGNQSVGRYKQLISQQYGARGTNISNLISADYYEDYVLPTYNQLLQDEGDDAEGIFSEIYEEAVTQYPFAVFVAASRNHSEIKEEVLRKIQLNVLNDRHSLNIHGIGKKNQKTIMTILGDQDISKYYVSEPDIVTFSDTLFARLYF